VLGDFVSTGALQWINLAVIAAAIYIIYKVFTNTKLAQKFTDALRRRIVKREIIKTVSFEELMVATAGYGVSKIEVREDSPILNKTLAESGLRSQDITVLAVIRAGETMPNPSAKTKIALGDELVCFGRLENIRNTICVVSE
jgi:K+/H+ antiporter YhaU regulatory subunit KhtT